MIQVQGNEIPIILNLNILTHSRLIQYIGNPKSEHKVKHVQIKFSYNQSNSQPNNQTVNWYF